MARTLRSVLERAVPRLANLVVAAGALFAAYWAFGEAAVGALRISTALVVALAAWKPGEALVLLAAFGPLGGALAALTHSAASWTLPLTLAVVGGDALGRALRGDRVADRWLIATAAAWGGVVGWSLWSLPNAGRAPGVSAALLAMSGVATYALTNEECLRHEGLGRRVTRALMLGVAAVGALNMNRAAEIALRRPPFWAAITDVLRSIRVSSTFPDFNAAGALFLLLALFSLSALRDRSLRAAATCSAPFIMAGLWLSGSRTALIVLPAGIAILVSPLTRRRQSLPQGPGRGDSRRGCPGGRPAVSAGQDPGQRGDGLRHPAGDGPGDDAHGAGASVEGRGDRTVPRASPIRTCRRWRTRGTSRRMRTINRCSLRENWDSRALACSCCWWFSARRRLPGRPGDHLTRISWVLRRGLPVS